MLNPFESRFVTETLRTLQEVSQRIQQSSQGIGLVAEAHMSIFIDYHIVVEPGDQGLVIVLTIFDNYKVIERISERVKEDANFRVLADLQPFDSDFRTGWTIRLTPATV